MIKVTEDDYLINLVNQLNKRGLCCTYHIDRGGKCLHVRDEAKVRVDQDVLEFFEEEMTYTENRIFNNHYPKPASLHHLVSYHNLSQLYGFQPNFSIITTTTDAINSRILSNYNNNNYLDNTELSSQSVSSDGNSNM
jgi:hypothetical protein